MNFLSDINWLSVVLLTVLSFILGGLWHSPVMFGKAWSKELNRNKDAKINAPLIFGLSAVAHFIALVLFAAFVGHDISLADGIVKGLIVSIGWISAGMGVTYLFASRSLKLFLIDAGFYVVFFVLAGIVFSLW